jgi:hypothetical protein
MTFKTKTVSQLFKASFKPLMRDQQGPLWDFLTSSKWVKATERVAKHPYEARIIHSKDECLPLHFAIKEGAPFVLVQALVRAFPQSVGVVESKSMRTPLNLAALFDKSPFWYETFSFLYVKHPQAANLSDKYGRIPIHYLAYRNKLKAIEMLLKDDIKYGMVQDKDGYTAAHVAAQYNDSKQAFTLLASLCPLAMQEHGKEDKTPMALAKEFGKMEVEERRRRCKQLSSATERSTVNWEDEKKRRKDIDSVFAPPTVEELSEMQGSGEEEMDSFFAPPTVEEMSQLKRVDVVSDVSCSGDTRASMTMEGGIMHSEY